MEWTALPKLCLKLVSCMVRIDGKMVYHQTKTILFLWNQETLILYLILQYLITIILKTNKTYYKDHLLG